MLNRANWTTTLAAVLLALFLLQANAAGDEAEAAAAKVRAAEAKVAAKDYPAALKLYEEAFRLAAPDRPTLVDAARCAFSAKAIDRAMELAGRASEGAEAQFLESEKGRQLQALMLELKEEARRARERYVWTFTEKAVKNLPLHVKGLDLKVLEPETLGYRLKKEQQADDLRVDIYVSEKDEYGPGGDVKAIITHSFETREQAERRFEDISQLIRGQQSAWNAKYGGRPRKKLSEYTVDVTLIKPVGGKSPLRRLIFCWDPQDPESARLSSPALVDLFAPPSDPDPKDQRKLRWDVTLVLESLYFR